MRFVVAVPTEARRTSSEASQTLSRDWNDFEEGAVPYYIGTNYHWPGLSLIGGQHRMSEVAYSS